VTSQLWDALDVPQGRSTFTPSELDQIRRLVREKQVADRDRQKSIRARLRAMGFRISDFADYPGFVESDLDDLIARGAITVMTEESGDTATVSVRARSEPHSQPPTRAATPVRKVDDLAEVARDAMRALAVKAPLDKAERSVPARPGLYAIYADAETWRELGLGDPPDERPLYVGKAEDSLVTRDVATHFGTGRTGSSTVRRSFAALLREPLRLSALPRNPDRPERFANYGLSREHDERLTAWMRTDLELAVWPKPEDCEFSLLDVERVLLGELRPPLNLKDVMTPWTAQLKTARAAMARQARAWAQRAAD
jgi:hypothetical protein